MWPTLRAGIWIVLTLLSGNSQQGATEQSLPDALLQDTASACSEGECLASQLLQKGSEARRKGNDSPKQTGSSELSGNISLTRLISRNVSLKPVGLHLHSDLGMVPLEQASTSSGIFGQARGLLAFVQASATRSTLQESASSSAVLLLICIIAVAVSIYAMSVCAADVVAGKSQRQVPAMANLSALNTRGSLPPRPAAENLLGGWPSMTTPAASSRQVPRQSLRPSRESFGVPPVICEDLVRPDIVTRLAVPVLPLLDGLDVNFDNFDVLSILGEPLLCAASLERFISISSYHGKTQLATVTPGRKGLEIHKANGALIGSLSKQSPGRSMNQLSTSSEQYILRNSADQIVLVILLGQKTPHELKMLVMQDDGTQPFVNQKAVVTRKEAGMHLPAEHFEINVDPNIDAVLVLSIFLGMVFFALPPVPHDVQLQKSSATLPAGSSPLSFAPTPRPQSFGGTSRPSLTGPYSSYH
eukprot:TRINITY_DN8771_c0_g1_i1.p1 TRINITY_DN8771_c0_g1~~TRINITY_DN8771_c0_g1_i1.p1  ORF type:complete len:472 (+),score=62.28 TRINITY_DN8771_c0_g1_i1:216-1631(+)